MAMLFDSEIFVEIGHCQFRIPRDLFSSPGDSPNYFSLGFAMFFSNPTEAFPGVEEKGLLRPPPISPPKVPHRSAEIFAELLHTLQGYPIKIRDEEHREALLRDCRYFHLRGLEQKLVRHNISFNLKRGQSEIVLRLEDIRQSGIAVMTDNPQVDSSMDSMWVRYARPYVDEISHVLLLEIVGESTKIDLRLMRADFFGQAKARIASLFQVIANKMNLPATQPLGLLMMSGGSTSQPPSPANTPLSDDQVRVVINHETHILLDGEPKLWKDFPESRKQDELDYDEAGGNRAASLGITMDLRSSTPSTRSIAGSSPGEPRNRSAVSQPSSTRPPSKKRKRAVDEDERPEWVVKNGKWRLQIQKSESTKGGMEIVLVAIKLSAYSGESGRNAQESFLS
jgi:hypothetical protein